MFENQERVKNERKIKEKYEIPLATQKLSEESIEDFVKLSYEIVKIYKGTTVFDKYKGDLIRDQLNL